MAAGSRGRFSARAAGLVAFGASTALVAWPLAWNRFPFVYWDTSEYLWRWASMRPGFDRPLFYSLFLAASRAVPFGLYAAALFQAALAAALLVALARAVFPEDPRRAAAAALAGGAAVAATPAAFHAVTLMPDASALWIALAIPVVALAPSPALAAAAAAALALATPLHGSNLLILAAMALPAILAARLAGRPAGRAALLLGLALALQPLAMAWNSARAGLGFAPRPTGSDFFLAARLQETGLLEKSFRELAAESSPPIPRETAARWADGLARQEKSVEGLLWSPSSPLNREFPGWRDSVPDYRGATAVLHPAVRRALLHHTGAFVEGGVANARAIASGRFQLEGFVRHGEGSGVERVLAGRWGRNLARYRAGRQGLGDVPAKALPRATRAFARLAPWSVLLACVLPLAIALAALLRRRSPPLSPAAAAALLLGLFVAVDVAACATFGMAASRYLERVVALPLVALVLLGFRPYRGGRRGEV